MKNKHNSKISIMLSFAFSLIMVFSAVALTGCSIGGSKKAAGLYDATGKQTYTWEKLIEDKIFSVSGIRLSRGENFSSEIIAGELILPTNITDIGSSICRDCSYLTSVTIPDGVTRIGKSAFEGCTGLASITIPKKITEMDTAAFAGCTGLTNAKIENGVTEIGWKAFKGCTSLTSITIPNSVTEIGRYAFEGCAGLTNVSLGGGVEVIGMSAFSGCTGLTSITIPASVTRINTKAFENCESLTKVKFENSQGWSAGDTALASDLVSNEGLAATKLTTDYVENAWSRT